MYFFILKNFSTRLRTLRIGRYAPAFLKIPCLDNKGSLTLSFTTRARPTEGVRTSCNTEFKSSLDFDTPTALLTAWRSTAERTEARKIHKDVIITQKNNF